MDEAPLVILANEDVPLRVVEALRAHGHDVSWVRNQAPGAADREVLHWIIGEERVLVTFDREFAELAAGSGLQEPCGVVCFRTPLLSPEAFSDLVVEVLESRSDWSGHFSLVEDDHVQMRVLAGQSEEEE